MNKKIISGVLLCTMLAYTTPVLAFTKDETVYSKIDANGKAYNTIVSDHITNENQEKMINDISDLLNIKNVNGDEELTQNGNSLVWNADGSDIYYQGESQKDLPIECNIKYELDGKEITAQELAGKSGKVKITIEYKNKDAHTVNINGRNETLYTPFVVVCGTILDNEHHRNIEITNGKVIDDGSKTTVLGISLPGMQESLAISKDKLEIPSTIEITMDSTDFELSNVVTYVTPKIIEENDMDIFNKLDDVYGQVNMLQNSSKQLEDGANTLKAGVDTYAEKSQEFNNAMNQIAQGTGTINSNYNKIDEGINTLNAGSTNLTNGAEQLNSGINQLSSSVSNLPQGIEALYQGSINLDAGINGIAGGVNTLKDNLSATTTTSITELTKNNAVLQKTIEALGEEQPELVAALKAQKAENEQIIKALTPTEETNAKMQALNNGLNAVTAGSQSLKENLGNLNSAVGQLPEAINKITAGSNSLEKGTKTLQAGASNLNSGSKALKNGINSLDTNTQKLAIANNQLTEGTTTISDGVTTLTEGITKFNKEGIDKICNYINRDVKNVINRLEKLQELSQEYNSFTMLNNGEKGNVKFIMVMDSVKKAEESKEEIIVNDKNKENDKSENKK